MLSARLSPEDGALLLAALEAGHPGVTAETSPAATRNADALVGAAQLALSAAEQTDRGDARCQVVVHADAPVLSGHESDGRCHLDDGPRLAPETARRLSCDAELTPVLDDIVFDDGHVSPHRLFESLVTLVLDAQVSGDDPLVRRCLTFVDTTLRGGDDHTRQLIARSFVANLRPWGPTMAEFIATWPDTLRQEAIRQAQEGVDLMVT